MTVDSELAGAPPVAAAIMAAVSDAELVTMLTTVVVVEDPFDSFGLRGAEDVVVVGATAGEG